MGRYVVALLSILALLVLFAWPETSRPPSGTVELPESTPDGTPRLVEQPTSSDEVETRPQMQIALNATCSSWQDERTYEERQAEFRQQQDEMFRVLRVSGDPELLLVAALSGKRNWPGEAQQIAAQVAGIGHASPLVASQLLELCLALDSCRSDLSRYERILTAADTGNGLAWTQVAVSRLARGEDAGALTALGRAVAASTVEDHYAESVLMFDRALSASVGLPSFERTSAASLHAAMHLNSGIEITRHCTDKGTDSAEWRDVCLRLGERFEAEGRITMIRSLGLGLQAKMYEYGNDLRAAKSARRRQDDLRNELSELVAGLGDVTRDPTVQRKFIEIMAASGEMAALRYALAAEGERRALEPGAGQNACGTP